MKKATFISMLLCFMSITIQSQELRYFEFRAPYEDTFTSFIVATSDNNVINEVLNDLLLPIENRRFISGTITTGHGGFNHNGTDWHTWHYIPNQWQLTVVNVEHCDGIVETIGSILIDGAKFYFCPWSSYPYQEITDPILGIESNNYDNNFRIYPNPATESIIIDWVNDATIQLEIHNTIGQLIFSTSLTKQNRQVDISNLSNGMYIVRAYDKEKSITKRIIVN